jgi:hypothetical protein
MSPSPGPPIESYEDQNFTRSYAQNEKKKFLDGKLHCFLDSLKIFCPPKIFCEIFLQSVYLKNASSLQLQHRKAFFW